MLRARSLRRMGQRHRLPDRREGVPLHRQAGRHPAHAHGPQAAA